MKARGNLRRLWVCGLVLALGSGAGQAGDIIAWWGLYNDLSDSSGYGNHLTQVGTIGWNADFLMLELAGAGHVQAYFPGANLSEFTLLMWVMWPGSAWDDFAELGAVPGTDGYVLEYDPTFSCAVALNPGGIPGASELLPTAPDLTNGLHRLALVGSSSAGKVQLFVDGILRDSGAWSATAGMNYLTLGGRYNTSDRNLSGYMVDVQLYNVDIGEQEIKYLSQGMSYRYARTFWQAGEGGWDQPANWTLWIPSNVRPRDRAVITNSGTAVVDGPARVGYLYLGYAPGEAGTVELKGLGSLSASSVRVGYYGTGSVRQVGGTSEMGDLYLGEYAGSQGTYELNGSGRLSVSGVIVGTRGSGTFRQTGGTLTVEGTLYLGSNAPGEGEYELGGTGRLTAIAEQIGYYGRGTFVQTGGVNKIMSSLYIGLAAGAYGIYELGGMGSISAPRQYVGKSGTGTFIQTGGTNYVTGQLWVGYESAGLGTYELGGTGLIWAFNEYIGNSGTGTFRQTGGTNDITEWLSIAYASGSRGTYELSGGALKAVNVYVGGSDTVAGGTGVLRVSDSGVLTVGQAVKLWTDGTVALLGGRISAPVVDATAGTFDFPGGRLEAGTFLGNLVNAGGTLCPGASPDILEIQGDYTQSAGALEIEIGGLLPGTEYDRLACTGLLTLGGRLDVVLIDLGGGTFAPMMGDRFDVLDWGGLVGQFDALNLPALGGGLAWDTLDLYVTGELAVVPEPPGLAVLALCGLALRRRRGRNH